MSRLAPLVGFALPPPRGRDGRREEEEGPDTEEAAAGGALLAESEPESESESESVTGGVRRASVPAPIGCANVGVARGRAARWSRVAATALLSAAATLLLTSTCFTRTLTNENISQFGLHADPALGRIVDSQAASPPIPTPAPTPPPTQPPPPYLAVLLHLGSLHLVPEFIAYFRHLDEARVRFDLLVSVTEGRLNQSDLQLDPLRLAYPSARLVPVPNHGMDIGGFLHLVPLVLQANYSLVLKLHSKTTDWWRTEMLQPLIGTTEQARFNVDLFQRFPRVGLVGPIRYHFYELEWSTVASNVRHMIELVKQFGFPPIKNGIGTEFIGGTTSFMRRAVLDCAFGGKDLRRWTDRLTPGGKTGGDGVVEHGWDRPRADRIRGSRDNRRWTLRCCRTGFCCWQSRWPQLDADAAP